ncbi:MAG: hypothetical protein V4488_19575 [Pseudomonadota bacterium]
MVALRITAAMATLALALGISSAHAAPVCSLIQPAVVESLIGAKLASKDELKGVVSEDCSYMTVPNEGGPGFFSISRLTRAIPAGSGRSILTSIPGSDKFVDIAGLGDEAVMNTAANDLAVRSGTVWYHIVTRGMQCPGDTFGAATEVKERCRTLRNDTLSKAARLIVGPKK